MSLKKKVVWLPYDFDSAIGINNDGELVFDYQLEDIDYQRSGAPIFNGQDSVIWKNIRAAFADELKTMYQNLRSSGALSYDKVEKMFEEHQSKWSEAIFNEDSQFKYIEPFVKDNQNYLYMLLGSKEEQRKWWLYNRFRYIDSKYIAGDARSDSVFLRPYAADDITVIPYADIYATVAWDATITQKRAERNKAITLECPYDSMNGNIVNIYSSSQLASIGDLSGLQIGQIDISSATRLQSLKIGDSDAQYDNSNLYSLTFGNNVLLKSVDVRNCSGLGDTTIQGHTQTTVDLSGCSIIEEVYFNGTKIAGVTLPNGGVLKTLQLPKTITNLTVMNQPSLATFSVEDNDYSNISTLRIENCGSAIPIMDILDDIPANSRVRLVGFTIAASGLTDAAKRENIEAFYDYLDTMRGLDEQGSNVDTAQVQGTITGIDSLTGSWLAQMKARYPYIDITYNHITSNLYYYNGETLYYTETILDGADGVYTGTPTKADSEDGHYSYTFAGWSKDDDNTPDADARTAITADRNIYACYTATVKTYTVTWVNNGTTVETDSNVPWGTVPHYDGTTPTKDGQTSTGWLPDPTQPITGNTTFVAQYLPVYTVTFKNDTGTTTLDTQNVVQGQTATYGGTTPTSSEDASLAWLGWATSANAHTANAVLTNVQSDMTVYAAFESAVEVAEITDSWDTIIANIDNGTYSTKYKVGNYKPLDLGTEGTINMQIVAMDADELASGGYAPLTFIDMELLSYTIASNVTGNSLTTKLETDILPLFPSGVASRLQRVRKGYWYSDTYTYTDRWAKLWIPGAYAELGGLDISETTLTNPDYASVYKDNASRVKQYNGTNKEYFLRDGDPSNRYYVRIWGAVQKSSGGSIDYRNLCLGFCLGLEPETIEDDWSTILANTNPSTSYSIGDTKMIDLGTEGKHLMEIVAFDEDDKADGSGKAKITWISKTLLNTEHRWNPTLSPSSAPYTEGTGTIGGWEKSEIRVYLKDTIKPLIPSEVRSAIVEVVKYSSNYDTSGSRYLYTSNDDVWLPSTHELNFSGSSDQEKRGAQYTWYSYDDKRIKKYKFSNSIYAGGYFTRTSAASGQHRSVLVSGKVGSGNAASRLHIAIGFCTDVVSSGE